MTGPEGSLIHQDASGGGIYQGGRHAFGYLALHRIECVALLAHEFQPKLERLDVLRAPFRDIGSAPPDEVEEIVRTATSAATWVVERVRAGRNVLVSCFSGFNRSGLVSALSVMRMTGIDGAAATELVRERRSPFALNNDLFCRMLRDVKP